MGVESYTWRLTYDEQKLYLYRWCPFYDARTNGLTKPLINRVAYPQLEIGISPDKRSQVKNIGILKSSVTVCLCGWAGKLKFSHGSFKLYELAILLNSLLEKKNTTESFMLISWSLFYYSDRSYPLSKTRCEHVFYHDTREFSSFIHFQQWNHLPRSTAVHSCSVNLRNLLIHENERFHFEVCQ